MRSPAGVSVNANVLRTNCRQELSRWTTFTSQDIEGTWRKGVEEMTHHKLHRVGSCLSIDQDLQSAHVELGCTTLHDRWIAEGPNTQRFTNEDQLIW